MSIANGTTHYNYPQVQLTDRPTFADFNPAFADIDSKLYGLITGASTDHSAIESLQTGLGETNLLLASVKNTADSASGKADTNAENITLLQTGLGNTDRAVATKLDSVAIAEPYDASAGTYAIGDIVVYNGQRYKCTTAVAVAEPFDADKWTGEDVETVLEHLQNEIDSIPTGGTAANITLAPITGMTADDVQEGIAELKSDLTWKHLNDFTTANITFTDVGAHEYYIESEFASMNLFIPVGQNGRTGYYASVSDYGDFYVSATNATSITISQLTHNGTDVTSDGVHVYYR